MTTGETNKQIGDVVEAAARVVGGQQQLEVELGRQVVEREQVADRVAVLGAREAPEHRHVAGLRLRRRPRRRAPLRGRPRRARSPSCAGRGSSGGIDSARSLRTIFSQCSGSAAMASSSAGSMTRSAVRSASVMAIDAVARRGGRARRPRRRAESRPTTLRRAPGKQRLQDRRRTAHAHLSRNGSDSTRIGRSGDRLPRAFAWPPPPAGRILPRARNGRGTASMVRARRSIVVAVLFAGSLPLAAAGTPLIDAVKRQDRVAVNALLDRGADVNAAEGDGTTALHWAAQLDDLAIVDLLLEAGAARRGRESLQRDAARARGQQRQRARSSSACSRRRRSERALARRPNAADERGAERPRRRRRSAARARRRRSTRPRRYRGQTALMWAAGEGNVDVVRALIAAGANVTAKIEVRFHAAAVRGAQRASSTPLRVLLDHGANVERSRAGRHERAERRDRQRVLRGGVRAARPRRRPESARRARVAAAHDRVAAQAGRDGSRRRRRRARDVGAAADRQGHEPRARAEAARSRREPERARRLGGDEVRDARRHDAQSAGARCSAGICSPTTARRRSTSRPRTATPSYMRLLAAGRRRSVDHESLRHHAADGGRRASTPGKARRRGRTRACPRPSGSRP